MKENFLRGYVKQSFLQSFLWKVETSGLKVLQLEFATIILRMTILMNERLGTFEKFSTDTYSLG